MGGSIFVIPSMGGGGLNYDLSLDVYFTFLAVVVFNFARFVVYTSKRFVLDMTTITF